MPRELAADPVVSRVLRTGLRTSADIGAAAEALTGYDVDKLRGLAGALIAHDSPSDDSKNLLRMAVDEWLSKDPWSCLEWLLKKAESGEQVDALLAIAAKRCSTLDLDRVNLKLVTQCRSPLAGTRLRSTSRPRFSIRAPLRSVTSPFTTQRAPAP